MEAFSPVVTFVFLGLRPGLLVAFRHGDLAGRQEYHWLC
jgi:hypothetical protein